MLQNQHKVGFKHGTRSTADDTNRQKWRTHDTALLLLVTAVYNTAKAHPVLSACTFTKNRRRQPVLIEVENAFSSVIGILLHNIRRHTISVCSTADDVHDPD